MSRPADRILAERLEVVLSIGEANAERHRAQAMLGGAQIEIIRVEMDDDITETSNERAEAHAADDAARAALQAAEGRILSLEARLAELDRELSDAER